MSYFLKELNKKEAKSNKIKDLIWGMYNDHVNYPQLKLPKMQADRLNQLLKLIK